MNCGRGREAVQSSRVCSSEVKAEKLGSIVLTSDGALRNKTKMEHDVNGGAVPTSMGVYGVLKPRDLNGIVPGSAWHAVAATETNFSRSKKRCDDGNGAAGLLERYQGFQRPLMTITNCNFHARERLRFLLCSGVRQWQ